MPECCRRAAVGCGGEVVSGLDEEEFSVMKEEVSGYGGSAHVGSTDLPRRRRTRVRAHMCRRGEDGGVVDPGVAGSVDNAPEEEEQRGRRAVLENAVAREGEEQSAGKGNEEEGAPAGWRRPEWLVLVVEEGCAEEIKPTVKELEGGLCAGSAKEDEEGWLWCGRR